VGFQDFVAFFKNEVLSLDMAHIDDLLFLEMPVLLWAFFPHA
jgi:hypothetical protein